MSPLTASTLAVAGSFAILIGANAPPGVGFGAGATAGILALACMAIGGWALRWLDMPSGADLRFLAGATLLAYALTVPAGIFGINILIPALIFSAIGAVLLVLRRDRGPDLSVPGEWVALTAAGGFAVIWALETTTRFAAFPASGFYPLALDATMFTGLIAELGDWRMVGRLNSSMVDVPYGLYHFASFGFPALAVRSGAMDALQALPRVWITLGPLFVGLGLHALGRGLAGAGAGAFAILLLAILPDPASYGFAQPFLSFHWMLEVSPGAPYAIGTISASLALMAAWCETRRWRLLAGSAALMALSFLLRAHIVLWAAIPWAAVVVGGWPGLRPWLRAALLAAGAVILVPALLYLSRGEIAAGGLAQFLGGYLKVLHQVFVPNGSAQISVWLIDHLGLGGAAVPMSLLAVGAMGGLPLLTFLLGALLLRRRLTAIDLFPFALLAWACMLMVLAPTPFHGDNSEYRQRGFLLVVVALLAWNAKFLALGMPALARRPAAIGTAACLGLLVTWSSVTSWKTPRTPYFLSFRSTPVAPSLVEGGAWLRAQAVPGGSFTVAAQDTSTNAADDATLLMAFSGQPAWLSRPGIHLRAGGHRAAEARRRLDVLAAVAAAPDRAEALALLCGDGVSFYAVTGNALPGWDPAGDAAAFRAPGLTIWKVTNASGGTCTTADRTPAVRAAMDAAGANR